ncbi:MAG: hypothetical protein FWC81_02445 [Coriobacteriia bacterium]|nr:hypothetical protein [Coriobacteriia bacterium]MCL2605677.1 hypothetical protein [Coriobacteriia bacterium]
MAKTKQQKSTRQRKSPRLSDGRIMRASVWVASVCFIVALLPAAVGTVWIPSCETCHNSEDFHVQTELRSHSRATCIQCHGGMGTGQQWQYRQRVMYQMVIPVFGNLSGNPNTVADDNCLVCHADIFAETTFNNGLFMNHDAGIDGHNCVDCHSTVTHGIQSRFPRTYNMNSCLTCHAANVGRFGTTNDCSLCHEGNHESVGVTEVRMTHGSEWRTTHAMGNLNTCWACHPQDYCVRCHGVGYPHSPNYISAHGRDATDANADCASCHQNTQWCDDCHGGHEMPHPDNFLQDHAQIADHVIDDESCLVCHIQNDCAACHAAHAHPGGSFTPESRYPHR